MKLGKRIMGIMLSCALAMSALAAPVPARAESVEGDLPQNPIVLEQTGSKTTNMLANHNIKYFRIKVDSTGKLKLTLNSKKLKKVTLTLCYDDLGTIVDTKTIKYNKDKKVTKGTLTSSWVLNPGAYTVQVGVPTTANTDKAFTLSCKHVAFKYDDVEPNNSEETAQPMTVKLKAVKYTCFVSDTTYATDNVDNFKFNVSQVNSNKTFQLTAKANSTAKIRLLIKHKTDSGYEVINSSEKDQYFTANGTKSTFQYSGKLPVGDYVVMVWLQDGQKSQTEYTISAMYKS